MNNRGFKIIDLTHRCRSEGHVSGSVIASLVFTRTCKGQVCALACMHSAASETLRTVRQMGKHPDSHTGVDVTVSINIQHTQI